MRPGGAGSGIPDSELTTYSVPISLGASYHPLYADGTQGVAITSIQLRAAEASILIYAGALPTPGARGRNFKAGYRR